jgi:AcrR family transcriptional regulator
LQSVGESLLDAASTLAPTSAIAAISWRAMPAQPKTSDAEIVSAARTIIEREGRDFSMAQIAASVGIRGPSLYGRFPDRGALLAAVEIELWRELQLVLSRAARGDEPRERLAAVARAYRAFGKANPKGYALMYDARAERTKEGHDARAAAYGAARASFVALVGEADALLAGRTVTPFLHGFVSMELAGAFRFGSGLDEAFEFALATILDGLVRGHSSPAAPRPKRRPSKNSRAPKTTKPPGVG